MVSSSCLESASYASLKPSTFQKKVDSLYSLFFRTYNLSQALTTTLNKKKTLIAKHSFIVSDCRDLGLKGFSFVSNSSLNVYDFVVQALDLNVSWKELVTSNDKVDFLYETHLLVLNLLEQHTYTCFDAHTTSNCCHGISIFVNLAINQVLKEDLRKLRDHVNLNYQKFLSHQCSIDQFIELLPKNLLAIVTAYLLFRAGSLVQDQGRITVPEILSEIHSGAGKKFSIKLVRKMQKKFSYAVSNCYAKMLLELPKYQNISQNSVKDWGKYVGADYIRMDKRSRFYASCLFSTQVTLAYLAAIKNKIAFVCDVVTKNYEKVGRYIALLQGDGEKFVRIPEDTFKLLDLSEPVFVVSGFSCLDGQSILDFSNRIDHWIKDLPTLILANDTHYPQFPKVGDDSDFNFSPIDPDEKSLKTVISKFSKIKGVSKEDPTLFFQNHYYPASLYEVLKDTPENCLLPFAPSFTPRASFS